MKILSIDGPNSSEEDGYVPALYVKTRGLEKMIDLLKTHRIKMAQPGGRLGYVTSNCASYAIPTLHLRLLSAIRFTTDQATSTIDTYVSEFRKLESP